MADGLPLHNAREVWLWMSSIGGPTYDLHGLRGLLS